MMANRNLLLLGLIGLSLSGCDSTPDVTSNTSGKPSPDGSGNSFFNAITMNTATTTGTLTGSEVFYKFHSPLMTANYSGTLTLGLTGLTGNADLELFDRNLNRISWSNESGTTDETIPYWYSTTRHEALELNGLHFVRIRNTAGTTLDYTLTFRFE